MSAVTGPWVIPVPFGARYKDYNPQRSYVRISGRDYEITKMRKDVEAFSTREEALLNSYFVMASRIPVIGAVFSAAIALYSFALSLRHICNSMSMVTVCEKKAQCLLHPSLGFLTMEILPDGIFIYRKESKSEAFSTLAKFHTLNMCTLGLVAFAVASYSYCKKDD